MKYVFSTVQAVVIVVLKEACNELREYGISNPLQCHEEQKRKKPKRSQCMSFKHLKSKAMKTNLSCSFIL